MKKDLIKFENEFYIRVSSSLADSPVRVLKDTDSFAIFSQFGDICPIGFEDHGLFRDGCRFLSRYDFHIHKYSPLLLSSNIKESNDFFTVDMTNPDIEISEGVLIRRGDIHLIRIIFLLEGNMYERLVLNNYTNHRMNFSVSYEYTADYIDLFELRGIERKSRGQMQKPQFSEKSIVLSYLGLDSVLRSTCLSFSDKPDEIDEYHASFQVELKPKQKEVIETTIQCLTDRRCGQAISYAQAHEKKHELYKELQQDLCFIETSNSQFNDWINQSRADLFMLLSKTPYGLYPYAGIPWYSTIFGRDGLITGLESLWIYPHISRGVLQYLAAYQSEQLSQDKDAEPGKILHEQRKGEMADLKEIPFGCYYGTVDATALFVILAGHYFNRTADKDFIRMIWPNIEGAIQWIDEYGDRDRDGFIKYHKRAIGGLSNQGWKDSHDSIFHQNGELAESPVALCEVQGYVYEAKIMASRVASILHYDDLAKKWRQAAMKLRMNFYHKFWSRKKGTYGIALDGRNRLCDVRSSNAGQCLFTGIAHDGHAGKIIRNLMRPESFTGWGIRTIPSDEVRFNPMSYHNGSIWPHDNALIAFGMARYGYKKEALNVMKALFDASMYMDIDRLPELFCGFERRDGEGPILYPVACNPQAWSSASMFMFLQACLGMSVNAYENNIFFFKPVLPPFLEEVRIRNLHVGSARLDINLEYHPEDVGIKVVKRKGHVEVISVK
ncbi:MAG: glycogen debranching N-terminal domain-containing protein [Candidatus Omnitrophota bacterium]